MRCLASLMLFCLLIACNNNEQVSTETKDTTAKNTRQKNKPGETPPAKEPAEPATCYMQVLKRDTLVLYLVQNGNNVSGKLTYDNFEKDGSSGPVKGRVEGDVIKLLYSFASEGMNSVMEVYFKKTSDGLTRGIGEMQNRGDTGYFVDPGTISYPPGGNFKKTTCEKVPGKYK